MFWLSIMVLTHYEILSPKITMTLFSDTTGIIMILEMFIEYDIEKKQWRFGCKKIYFTVRDASIVLRRKS